MSLSQTGTFVETLIDLVDGATRANIIGFSSNNKLVLNGAGGPDGGSGIPWGGLVGQLIQRRVCYDTTEAATPCILPSSSLLDNLNHIRWHHQPATWFEMSPTDPRSMRVNIASGIWYKDEADRVEFTGGTSPIITSPTIDPRIDVVYLTVSGVVAVSEGVEAASPIFTIPSGTILPIGAVYVTPVACGIGWSCDTDLYSGSLYSGYIYKDLRPFITYPGGGGGVSDHNDLNGLQGGQVNQYYHLTQAQYIPVRGDIYYGNATPAMARLPIGAATFILRSNGTDPSWVNPALHVPLPPIAEGDIIYAGPAPSWARLVRGAAGTVLQMGGGQIPQWVSPDNIPTAPGGAGRCLQSTAATWESTATPIWPGVWTFDVGLAISAAQGIDMGNAAWLGNGAADMRVIFHAADHIEIATDALNIYTIDEDPSATTPMTATAANIAIKGGDNITGDDAGLWLRNEETNVDWSIFVDESDSDHLKIARNAVEFLEVSTTGNIMVFTGGDIDPEDATGQDLGSSTHRWDLYANDINMDNGGVIHCTNLGGPIITFDSISDYLEITECRVSIGHGVPVVALDINTPTFNHNGILLGSGGPPANLGMIKFTGLDFFGFTTSGWLSLTASGTGGGGGASLWTDYGAYIEPSSPNDVRIGTNQDLYPEDATGQDLGRGGNRWDIYARHINISDAGWIGILNNEILTFNAAGNVTFSAEVTSVVVNDGTWVGADAACSWVFDSTNGAVTTGDSVGIGGAPGTNYHLYIINMAVATATPYYGIANIHTRTGGATDHADAMTGIYNQTTYDNTGVDLGHFLGIQNILTLTDGDIGNGSARNMQGTNNQTFANGGLVTGGLYGQYNYILVDGTTVDVSVYGFYTNLNLNSGTVSGNAYGIYSLVDDGLGVTGTVYNLYLNNDAGVDYAIYSDGTAPCYFAGNVGIGTAAPKSPTEIANTTPANSGQVDMLRIAAGSDAAGDVVGIAFSTDGDVASRYVKSAIFHIQAINGDWGRGSLVFAVDSNADAADVIAADEKMRIGYNGYVGIAIAIPESKVHIYIGDSGRAPNANTALFVEDSDHAFIEIAAGATSWSGIYFSDNTLDRAGRFEYDHTNRVLNLYNNAHRLKLDGNGNVIVDDGVWIGADANCAWVYDLGNSYVTTLDDVGIGEAVPQRLLHVDGRVRIDDGSTAPGTAYAEPTDYYGDGDPVACGNPHAWLRIDIEGSTYKIPCYT